ncbi:site-specific integrase [Sulfobacillus sp. hq2]|uniref:site-specific integrase n=1 Tax=Sulfobacillus sp. hq2 TaxID=2039167 RepID=UPI000CD11FF9|nr:site-specific integrase [Sulfobacillus sp. hq2]POB12225.1 site-specific integrase [Sulfobacillus sp. hq2]
MNTVEPIRDKKQIDAIRKILAAQNLRDAAWFTLGINSGLRISDLLHLTVWDVRETPTKWRDRIRVTEQKTGKTKDFPLSATAKKALQAYLTTRPEAQPADPLFPSRKHGRPLQRGQAWEILRNAAQAVGVTDPVGTHTLRKTFGYWAFRSGVDLAIIQQILNHSSPGTTLAYIGIRREERDAVYLGLNL